jgi:putative addiction module killer protein
MNTILRTAQFAEWLQHLADVKGKARILARITAAEYGNFGDVKPIAGGIWEMRINAGPGYRVYYVRSGKTVYVLLAGGDKGSQRRDIAKALNLAKTAKE